MTKYNNIYLNVIKQTILAKGYKQILFRYNAIGMVLLYVIWYYVWYSSLDDTVYTILRTHKKHLHLPLRVDQLLALVNILDKTDHAIMRLVRFIKLILCYEIYCVVFLRSLLNHMVKHKKPKRNGWEHANNILKCILLNEECG